jgi:hypothetical protein
MKAMELAVAQEDRWRKIAISLTDLWSMSATPGFDS